MLILVYNTPLTQELYLLTLPRETINSVFMEMWMFADMKSIKRWDQSEGNFSKKMFKYHWGIKYVKIHLAVQAASSIQARKSSEIVEEGSSFKFEWDYVLQSSDKGKLREIIFGLWEKGYTSSYFITVSSLGKAVENPRLSKKHANYVGRVKWVGDISKSYLAFQLNNIKLSDNNTYGCQLDIGGFGQTIDSKITLIVKVRFGLIMV